MEQARWRINLLGRLSAERGDRRVAHFKTNKVGLLLARLAHEPRKKHRREELIEQIWPGEDFEQGRNSLRVALTSLRKILEPGADERGAVLAADREVVYLRGEGYVTDSAEFERCLKLAAEQTEDVERIKFLQEAVRLYQADFLTDFDAHWISGERARLSEDYHAALRSLALAHSSLRQFDQALAAAQLSLQVDPKREETHRLLMQIFALMGRPHAALRQYRQLEALLSANEIGRTPSRRTQDVLAKMYSMAGVTPPSETAPAPSPASPSFQPALSRKPPLRLPAPLTTLVGRDDEVLQVVDLIDTAASRLVTVTGMGGVGKTRLVLSVAHRLRRDEKQVCYLSLAGASNCDYLLPDLAAALRLSGDSAEDLWERIVTHLAESPFVLVLDNLEHLLPAVAAIVRRLLEAAPDLVCLTTSRHKIGMAGEYEYPLKPLSVPSASFGPAELLKCASVQLWMERVRAVQPHFEITPDICPSVITLCRRLDGLPLAIELAAAWAAILPPAEVARLLESQHSLLVSRDPTVEPRHSSIKATLDWSFDRLDPEVQSCCARLGLFPDGWTIAAACEVAGMPGAIGHILTLRERSLISEDADSVADRFRMPETVREYVLNRLGAEERLEAEARLLAYFVALAEEAEPALKGADVGEWMGRLSQEVEILRFALRIALRPGRDTESALRLSLALYRFWNIRGWVQEGRAGLSAALALAGEQTRERHRALAALGNLALCEGDLDAAEHYYTECKVLRSASGDIVGLAGILGNLGGIWRKRGEPLAARTLLQQSYSMFQQLGNIRGEATMLGNLAMVAQEMEDFATAGDLGQQSLDKFRDLGDKQNMIIRLSHLSGIAVLMGRVEHARTLLSESLELCTELKSEHELITVLAKAAEIAFALKSYSLYIRFRAAAQGTRSRLKIATAPSLQKHINEKLDKARILAGEASFLQEWEAGFNMTEAAATLLVRSYLTAPFTPA